MNTTLYNVGEDGKTREMEKQDGVAENAGHGVLTAMIIYALEDQLTSLMIDRCRPPASMQRLQSGEEQKREGDGRWRCGETGRQSCIRRQGLNRKPAFRRQQSLTCTLYLGLRGSASPLLYSLPVLVEYDECWELGA